MQIAPSFFLPSIILSLLSSHFISPPPLWPLGLQVSSDWLPLQRISETLQLFVCLQVCCMDRVEPLGFTFLVEFHLTDSQSSAAALWYDYPQVLITCPQSSCVVSRSERSRVKGGINCRQLCLSRTESTFSWRIILLPERCEGFELKSQTCVCRRVGFVKWLRWRKDELTFR